MTEIPPTPSASTGILPKFPAAPVKSSSTLTRSLLSLAIYLLAGYWLLGDLRNLLLITFVLLFHEAGHFLAMRQLGYRDLGVFFLPLLGAYVSGTKRVITQRESSIVLLAGPLPGILLGTALYFLIHQEYLYRLGPFELDWMALSLFLIVLNGINLLPVYPLDGGQLLNRVFLEEEGWISRLFLLLSAAGLTYLALIYRVYPLLIFPIAFLFRTWRTATDKRIDKRIEERGIHTELEYEELPDEDYWRIRTILIEENKTVRSWAAEHLEDYSPNEEQIRQAVEAQLHRTLIQDLSLFPKILILLIWLAGLITPIWLWMS